MSYILERLNDEIGTFMKHGADENLAGTMSALFGPIGYSSVTRNLNERVQQADSALNFQYLSFAMLLMGKTEQAKQYMQKAVELEPARLSHRRQKILDNLDRVQEIVTESIEDFDQLRTEKYEESEVGCLADYLVYGDKMDKSLRVVLKGSVPEREAVERYVESICSGLEFMADSGLLMEHSDIIYVGYKGKDRVMPVYRGPTRSGMRKITTIDNPYQYVHNNFIRSKESEDPIYDLAKATLSKEDIIEAEMSAIIDK